MKTTRFKMRERKEIASLLPDEREVEYEEYIETLKIALKYDMEQQGLSLNMYAEEFLETTPATLSRFLTGARGGSTFETVLLIHDKLRYGCSRHKSKSRLGRLYKGIEDFTIGKYWKYPTLRALARSLNVPKNFLRAVRNKRLQTQAVLMICNLKNMTFEDFIEYKPK